MGERLVPDAAGWWWRSYAGGPEPVEVAISGAYRGPIWRWGDHPWRHVEDDGCWLAPCLTPDDHAALLDDLDRLRATVERVEALRDELRAELPERRWVPKGEDREQAAINDCIGRITKALEAPDAD